MSSCRGHLSDLVGHLLDIAEGPRPWTVRALRRLTTFELRERRLRRASL